MKQLRLYIIHLALFTLAASCGKDFLEKRPNSGIVVPSTLTDFRQLLDRDQVMGDCPDLGELSCDNYYVINNWLDVVDVKSKKGYTWEKDIYEGQGAIDDWNIPYQQVFYSNIVLEGIGKLNSDIRNTSAAKELEGSAYFMRAYAHYNLLQIFAPVFDSTTSETDAGIPISLNSDVNKTVIRVTVKAGYQTVIDDALKAEALLPTATDFNNPNRPSQYAVWAFLARVYLSARAYEKALFYSDKMLQQYNKLLVYASISPTSFTPFPSKNDEILYSTQLLSYTNMFSAYHSDVRTDSTLFSSYNSDDLRKSLFFNLDGSRKNSYRGKDIAFSGLATDEIYLIRAECYARTGKIVEAMKDLNDLMRTRFKKKIDGTTTYVDQVANIPAEALDIILTERRKELCFRGIRWSDLRRLNKEGKNITLRRIVNGKEYTLPPNDLRWVLPIPPDEIALSGINQNNR